MNHKESPTGSASVQAIALRKRRSSVAFAFSMSQYRKHCLRMKATLTDSQEMIKIALTGAHGTGKTTLTTAVHEELSASFRTEICREVPRVIIETVGQDGFFQRGNNTPLRQCIIFLFQIMEDYFRSQNAEIVHSDRTMIDHLAYTLCLFPEFEHEADFIPIQGAIQQWMPTYHLIFKVPIEFIVQDDGVREGDIEFQKSIDIKIDQLYDHFGIYPFTISGTVEHRKRSVLSAILPLLHRDEQT